MNAMVAQSADGSNWFMKYMSPLNCKRKYSLKLDKKSTRAYRKTCLFLNQSRELPFLRIPLVFLMMFTRYWLLRDFLRKIGLNTGFVGMFHTFGPV